MKKLTEIKTEDGSVSYRNKIIDETYHTKSGAIEEAFEKHAKPLKIWEKNNPVIYDVCFGIGYNAVAAIDLIKEKNPDSKIIIYCFENDMDILEKCLEINPKFKNYSIIKEFVKNFIKNNKTSLESNNVKLIMMFGDAKIQINNVKENADYVFFDPFSPKKHPEMWEKEFFSNIFSKMNSSGMLSTYSFARIVKDNLKSVGFVVKPGPIIGRRSPSTIGIKEK